MVAYGVTEVGFITKKIEEIKQNAVDRIKGAYPDALLDSKTIEGNFVDISSDIGSLLWEVAEAAWNAGSVNHAFGISQDNLFTINNIKRLEATKSKLPSVTIFGTPGTNVVAGYSAYSSSSPDYVWKTEQNVVISAAGTVQVDFFCSVTGPVDLAISALDTPITVITAVTSLNNTFSTVVGRNRESDTAFLMRRNEQITNATGGSELAIKNALFLLNENETTRFITYAKVVSNRTNTVDAAGRAPHSFEVIINDAASKSVVSSIGSITKDSAILTVAADITGSFSIGDTIQLSSDYNLLNYEKFTIRAISFSSPTTTVTLNTTYKGSTLSGAAIISSVQGKDRIIAQTILDRCSAGIGMNGCINIDALDTENNTEIVTYSHPAPKEISLELTLTVSSALTTEEVAAVKTDIAAWGNSLGIGVNIIVFGFNCLVAQLKNPKITDVAVNIGYKNSVGTIVWVGDANITVNDGSGSSEVEFSSWNVSRITIS